jgi:hypothetical protein
MIYDIILYVILFVFTVLIILSCVKGAERNEANKKLEDKMNNLK